MSKEKLFSKIGEAVVNPSWESTTTENEQHQIKEIILEKQAARFIAHIQSKLAGTYHKGAVYTGDQETPQH